ncbi:MAG TPA: hydrogenase expression protein HupH [Tepidimicrobium sp.]|nr:hydrogenase expression protein HupH [Tepidimicrobium sp.]
MKIKIICPLTAESFEDETRQEMKNFLSEDVYIDVERIKYGTASIEGEYDGALAAPGILKAAQKAQEDGFDGIVISCMCDPAIEAAREIIDIPVVGPGRTSMIYAADISHKFAVISVSAGVIPTVERIGRQLGLGEKLVSVKALNMPVLELGDKNKLVNALTRKSIEVIDNFDAQAIILGCTGMMGVDALLEEDLRKNGYNIPVIYPIAVAIRYLESLIKLEMAHSRAAYGKPFKKERNILYRI